MMNLSTKVAYNAAIQIASKFIATALGLVAIGMITRYLGQNGFGQYTTVITFCSFFGIIADLGLTLVTVQLISKPGADENKILGNLLSLRLISALLFLGLAPITVFFFPYDPIVKWGVLITSISFLFTALNQILVGLFQKHLRMDKVSIAEVVNRLILVLGFFLSIRYRLGLNGIFWATVAANLVGFILHFSFSRKFVRIKLIVDPAYWKKIIRMSWPLAITIVLNLIYLKADTLLLSLIKRKSDIGIIAEVGIYGAAYKVIDVLVTVPFMFAGIVLPIMTAAWVTGNKERFAKVLQKGQDIMALIALPMVAGTFLVAKDVISFVAGKEFELSAPILKILIIAAAMIFLGTMYSHAVIALDKQKKIIKAYVFTALSSLALYLFFIPRYSYFGAAWITVYSEAMIALAAFLIVRKYSNFFPKLDKILRSSLATAGMVLITHLFKQYLTENLILVIGVALISYFVLLFIFKGFDRKDFLDLFNRQKV